MHLLPFLVFFLFPFSSKASILSPLDSVTSEITEIYHQQQTLPFQERKYILFRKTRHPGGWGNQLDIMITAMQVALETKRVFVVDYNMFELCFKPHSMIEWRASVHSLSSLSSKEVNLSFFHKTLSLARYTLPIGTSSASLSFLWKTGELR